MRSSRLGTCAQQPLDDAVSSKCAIEISDIYQKLPVYFSNCLIKHTWNYKKKIQKPSPKDLEILLNLKIKKKKFEKIKLYFKEEQKKEAMN